MESDCRAIDGSLGAIQDPEGTVPDDADIEKAAVRDRELRTGTRHQNRPAGGVGRPETRVTGDGEVAATHDGHLRGVRLTDDQALCAGIEDVDHGRVRGGGIDHHIGQERGLGVRRPVAVGEPVDRRRARPCSLRLHRSRHGGQRRARQQDGGKAAGCRLDGPEILGARRRCHNWQLSIMGWMAAPRLR